MTAIVAVSDSQDSATRVDASIVRRFLAWTRSAGAEDRADAVSALARAYLYSDLSESVRREAVVALTSVLDDPSAAVRRALAEALASAADAPRHIVVALANDQSDVARVVLARSPLLTEAELVDCAAISDAAGQTMIARRPGLPAGAAAAIAEIGERAAVVALASNLDADLRPSVLRRIFERFDEDADIREALLSRDALPASLRADLAAAAASALADFVSAREWLAPQRAQRIVRDAREQAYVTIARSSAPGDVASLVRRLRENGALTVALLMRALLSGDLGLFRQTLVEMAALPERRVAGFLRNWRGHGFAAVYARAGLPPHFLPAFRAALGVLEADPDADGEGVSHSLAIRMISACEKLSDPRLAPVLSMLWRLAGESAREQAREFTSEAAYADFAPQPQWFEPANAVDAVVPAAPPVVIDAASEETTSAPKIELDGDIEAALAEALSEAA